MNKVNLIGRLTADAEVRETTSGIKQARFNLAVNRNFLNEDGERKADFISCVAWRKTAELIEKHFSKGSEIAVSGRIQTGSYDAQDGSKRYTTDVIVEEITFVGSKREKSAEQTEEKPADKNDPFADFGNEVVIKDEDLPF